MLMAEFGRQFRNRMRGDPSCPSIAQLEALQFVIEQESPTMRDIALYLKVKAPSATSLINELVREKLLVRRGDPNDRRQIRIFATQKGESTLMRRFEQKKKIIASLLKRLDPKDRQELNRLLQKVLEGSNK